MSEVRSEGSQDCPFCKHKQACPAVLDDGETIWFCTRDRGHDDKHVACGVLKHEYKAWFQQNGETK